MTKLTTSVADQPWVDELVAHLDEGKPLNMACQLLGMSYSTVHRQALRDPELAAKLRAANARRAAKLWDQLRTMQEAYPAEWKKVAWQLEKTSPEFRESKDASQQVDQAIMAFMDRLIELLPQDVGNQVLDAMIELERQQAVAPPVITVEAESK